MEMETSIGKAAARVALKSHNNLWRETKKEEKKAFCVCLDFISSEVNLIFQGDSKRVIIQIGFKVAICQLHLIISLRFLPPISCHHYCFQQLNIMRPEPEKPASRPY